MRKSSRNCRRSHFHSSQDLSWIIKQEGREDAWYIFRIEPILAHISLKNQYQPEPGLRWQLLNSTEWGSCSNLVFNKISGIICPITTWSEGKYQIASVWKEPGVLENQGKFLVGKTHPLWQTLQKSFSVSGCLMLRKQSAMPGRQGDVAGSYIKTWIEKGILVFQRLGFIKDE